MSDGVLVIGGPTCSGKTQLALALAERFGAEIVGADSRQIYRGMEIGTAAPSAAERARVAHHLVGFLDPHERYSAARFVADARRAVAAARSRGKRAIVVGGTGFYLRAFTGGVALSHAYDPSVRARLAREARVHPSDVLHAWLAARDPARAAAVAPTDSYRIVRALEIALAPPSAPSPLVEPHAERMAVAKLVIDAESPAVDARIAARTDAMLAAGFVEEAERIGCAAVAADAVGYPLALGFLAGFATRDELRSLLIRETRRYAKRQRTWFRGEPGVAAFLTGDAANVLAAATRAARELLAWA